jgi:hypothetical protein
MFVFTVSHFSNDLSNVAELIDWIKEASYLSLRSMSIFDNGGNGFLEIKNKVLRFFINMTK